MEKTDILSKNTKVTYVTSIIFFIFVIVITFTLYMYNNLLTREIVGLQTKISLREWEIKEVEKDKNVQIYALLKANEKAINNLISRTRVTKFIKHLDETALMYNLEFKWFNLSNGQVKTEWISVNDDNWLAYQKISYIIKQYREDDSNLFKLWFVNWLNWVDSIKFNLNFNVK